MGVDVQHLGEGRLGVLVVGLKHNNITIKHMTSAC